MKNTNKRVFFPGNSHSFPDCHCPKVCLPEKKHQRFSCHKYVLHRNRADSFLLIWQFSSPQIPGFPELPSQQEHHSENPNLPVSFTFQSSISSATCSLSLKQELNSLQGISVSSHLFLGYDKDDPAYKHSKWSLLDSSTSFFWRTERLRRTRSLVCVTWHYIMQLAFQKKIAINMQTELIRKINL